MSLLIWITFFLAQAAPAQSPGTATPSLVAGFTAPRRTAILTSAEPGRLQQLLVKEGDFVESGQLVANLEDGAQRARLELSKHRAESELMVEQARIKQRRYDEDRSRIEELRSKGKASEAELIAAQADSDIARVQFGLAQWEHGQDLLDVELQSRLLERLEIRAPFAGFVAERLHEVGESVETRDGIFRLVELDPLTVVVDFPLSAAAGLAPGQAMRVIPSDPGLGSRTGTIEFVNRVADAASQTVRLKMRVPNEDRRWMAGMRVNVELPKSSPSAAQAAVREDRSPGFQSERAEN